MDLSCWKVHINLNIIHMKTVGIAELFDYVDGKRCRDTKYQIKLFKDQPMLSGAPQWSAWSRNIHLNKFNDLEMRFRSL
jgi:hypothetical protein